MVDAFFDGQTSARALSTRPYRIVSENRLGNGNPKVLNGFRVAISSPHQGCTVSIADLAAYPNFSNPH